MEVPLYVNGPGERRGKAIKTLVENDVTLKSKENFEVADVAIDFFVLPLISELLKQCLQHRKPVVIGDRTVYFNKAKKRIELKHPAQTREVFARGALYAPKFLKSPPSEPYSVKDPLYATC